MKDDEGWVLEGSPPRYEARHHFEVRIFGETHAVQRVGSRAPLCLDFNYGALIFSERRGKDRICDENEIEAWRARADRPVALDGTWDPSCYDQ